MRFQKIRILCCLLAICILTTNTVFAGDIVPHAVLKNEVEPNNTRSDAMLINQDDTVSGYISSSSDVDYYKIIASGSGMLNVWLGYIPSGENYDLYVYNGSGTLVGKSQKTSGTQESVSNIPIIMGSTYYFAVRGFGGSYSTTSAYKIRCRILMSPYTGYSQTSPENSATPFSTTNLDKLYSNNKTVSWLSRFKSAGCVIASYAMILRNLRATTDNAQYDFRTGNTAKLVADPFTVMLANTSWPTITASSDGNYIADTSQDPIYTYHARVGTAFGKTTNQVDLNGLSDTNKAYTIAYYLTLHPEGVAVSFQKSNGDTHTIVFTQTTVEVPSTYTPRGAYTLSTAVYDVASEISVAELQNPIRAANSAYDNEFTVCDPAGAGYYGAPQPFSTSYAASYYGFSSAYKIIFFS